MLDGSACFVIVWLPSGSEATKTRKAGAFWPDFYVGVWVNPQKTAPVGLKDGAHCWIRTNDPIGVNDVLYH